MEFAGKIVAVTGAASGIGRACAERFLCEGATVIGLDLRLEGIAGGCDALSLDISNEEAVQRCFEQIKARYGRLDALVNSAGVITFEKFAEHDFACWDKVMDINLRGTYACCRFAALIMREQRGGSIVNISAGAAKTGGMNPSPAYIASKGGINSLTFHFAVQLAPYGVRVNAICPGPIDTPMIDAQANLPGAKGNGKASIVAAVPLGLGVPDDIAYGALFLASDVRARYITGEILDINGGLVMD